MARAGDRYASYDFVFKDFQNLGAQGVRQVQGHDFNWSVVWQGYGEGVGATNSNGKCINVPESCEEDDCWYIEPSSSKVKHKEDAFVPGNFRGSNEDFSDPENYDFSSAMKFMNNTSFYYQPTLFITGLNQNLHQFVCVDENDEDEGYEEEDYCHENGAKSSDIDQCQWLYTPNGYKIELKDRGDYHEEIYEAVEGYLNVSAEKAASYGVHHFEIGNELERFPHPKIITYNWSYIDRYYMRLLKLSKKTLAKKFEELDRRENPKVIFAGLFSTDYEYDDYGFIEEPHNLDFLNQVLKEINSDMKDEGTNINDYFDIFNFHHYQGWTTLRAHINNLKNIFEDQIDDSDVLDKVAFWATELGSTTGDIDNGPFTLRDSSQGNVKYYCNGHLVNWSDGISSSDVSSSTLSDALENCAVKFVNNTLKESRNMLKYMAVAWGNQVKLINWHTHLQNSNYYLGLRVKYDNNTTAMDGCLDNEDDPTFEEFPSRSDHQNYCAKTSWFTYRLISQKLGNFGRSREIHYNKNGWFLYLFSKKQYEIGESSEPRFVSWLGCPENGGSCSGVSGKTEEVTIDQLLENLNDSQKNRYDGCLQVTSLKPDCSGNEEAFCSKFTTTKYNFRGDGSGTVIPVEGYPSIIEPCKNLRDLKF